MRADTMKSEKRSVPSRKGGAGYSQCPCELEQLHYATYQPLIQPNESSPAFALDQTPGEQKKQIKQTSQNTRRAYKISS